MNARDVKTAADARALVNERGLSHVKVAIVDLDGVMRGKYMAKEKFFSALESGFNFCDVIFGWDSNDQLYENATFTGWHTAFPDALVHIVPETCRDVPDEGNMVFFMGEFAGHAKDVCPRGLLNRVIARGEEMGYLATVAAEFEFFVFNETPHSVREKGYKNLENLTPGFYGYSMLRSSVESDFYHDLLEMTAAMDVPIEGLHTETGPGVLEAAIEHSDAMVAADRAAIFKTFSKVLAERQGKMLTFMAKWSNDWPGQSGHLHVSLKGKDGKSVFHEEGKPGSMSDEMRWFVGGADAGTPRHGRLHGQQLFAAGAGLLGADGCDLGDRESNLCAAGDPRFAEEPAGRVPGGRRRHQSLSGDRRSARLRAVGHREQNRTGCAH